ncbi:erythrose-4-phosphate dehydrogenase, partial [Klebsiella pneumoniae]
MRQVRFPRTICWITLSGKFAQGKPCRRSMTVRVAINGFGRIG